MTHGPASRDQRSDRVTDVVMLANAWGAGDANPTSKHRIAIELAKNGGNVLWVEGAGMRAPSLGSGRDRGRIIRKFCDGVRPPRVVVEAPSGGCVRVISPLSIPLPKLSCVRCLNGLLYRVAIRFWSQNLRLSHPLLINYVPVLAHAMAGWHRRGRGPAVYHCVDRWDAFEMYDGLMMARMDRACCEYADHVVASSAELGERCRRYTDRVSVVMHGVDYDPFAQATHPPIPARPHDLPDGPIIGFFGLLSEWVDQPLLCRLASDIPDVQIVLIGASDVAIERLAEVPNIHLLGPRPFAALPAYIAHFLVGMIPFYVNDLTRSVNPIKLREMLAAGCPVVSTALPEVQRVADRHDHIAVCDDHEAFVAACRAYLSAPMAPAARAALSRSMEGETWSSKVAQLLAAVRQADK